MSYPQSHILNLPSLILLCLLLIAPPLSAAGRDTLRVLCIGNSFSWDAVEQELAPLMQQTGQPIEIVNLYYGGCSLEQHYHFLLTDTAAYSMRIISNAPYRNQKSRDLYARENRRILESVNLRTALRRTSYHYISLQQASHFSGQEESFEPYLGTLLDTIRSYQPTARLCWMQTWAYAQSATHPAFVHYQQSQRIMYDSIQACTRTLLMRHPSLELIPCGAAIQLARSTMGDTLCRDGYHLSYRYGRYIASCVWYEVLTGRSCVGCKPAPRMDSRRCRLAQKAAHQAVLQRKCTF